MHSRQFMASKIHILNNQTINKIAAGEVIENPASVIKELIENSLDAGATNICVEIQEGGRQLIRVSDNGCGMSAEDALLCLERHATSKIREVEDIEDLLTMGFRGEAIPSIAAISKFTLLTHPHVTGEEQIEGTFIVVEGGQLISCSSAACSPGTTIEVKSLFFNVPVRRKFQRSPTFDSQEILKMIGLLALAYPKVQFELINDQKSVLKTPLTPPLLPFHESLGKRLECIMGKEYTSDLLPLKFQQTPYEFMGYIGLPSFHRPNRTGQHLFINQRLISSPLIGAAVREGYGTMLPNHRYPIFILHLHIPGSLLDINVHPQKREVRLRQESQLKEALIQSIQATLCQEQSQPNLFLPEAHTSVPIPPFWKPHPPFSSSKQPSSEEEWELKTTGCICPIVKETPVLFQTHPEVLDSSVSSSHAQTSVFSQLPSIEEQPDIPKVLTTLIGYCVIESFPLNSKLLGSISNKQAGGLILLDQKAAYSRIHYEKLLKHSLSIEIQPLLIPLTLQLSSSEFQILCEYAPLFNQMGFGLREFGERTFVVDAFPSFLKQNQLQTYLTLVIQDLIDTQDSRRLQIQKEEHLAWIACRASLPSNKRLSLDEAQGLVQQLLMCDLPAQCPMGKPICLYMDPEDINRYFQR